MKNCAKLTSILFFTFILFSCASVKQVPQTAGKISIAMAEPEERIKVKGISRSLVPSVAEPERVMEPVKSVFGKQGQQGILPQKSKLSNKVFAEIMRPENQKKLDSTADPEPSETTTKKLEPWGLASAIALAATLAISVASVVFPFLAYLAPFGSVLLLFSLIAAIVSLVRFGRNKGKFWGKAFPWITIGFFILYLLLIVAIIAILSFYW